MRLENWEKLPDWIKLYNSDVVFVINLNEQLFKYIFYQVKYVWLTQYRVSQLQLVQIYFEEKHPVYMP